MCPHEYLFRVSPEKWNRIISLVQTIVGVLTIYIIYLTFRLSRKIRKEFLKNHTKSKQVEMMSSLVQNLNQSKISIEGWFYNETGGGGSSWDLRYNIFEIGDLKNKNGKSDLGMSTNLNEYDDKAVLFNRKTNQIWDIKSFIDNPFIPKKIADELINFYSSNFEIVRVEDLQKNEEEIVMLKSKIFEEGRIHEELNEGTLIKGNAVALNSWLSLKSFASNLTETITKWFKDNGIDDLNLRIDFKN
jgi:hypothetical protein